MVQNTPHSLLGEDIWQNPRVKLSREQSTQMALDLDLDLRSPASRTSVGSSLGGERVYRQIELVSCLMLTVSSVN